MIKVLNTEQIQRCDRVAIEEYGIPEIALMENAGTQVVEAFEEFLGDDAWIVAVCCGKGNNGGDGLVVARHLYNLGRDVRVYLFGEVDGLEGSVATNYRIAEAMGVPISEVPDAESWRACCGELDGVDCIVDALFGTGISGGLQGYYGEVVDAINGIGAPVVAVDLPSGLTADGGEVAGPAIDADLTVTFAAPKLCHLLPPADGYCGELAVVDIGIPEQVIEAIDEALLLLTPEDCAQMVPPRRADTHKGSYGRVLVVAGAPGTTGAAVLTALGALRGGAGLVTVATPESVYPIVGAQLTEALVRPLPANSEGGLAEAAVAEIAELAASADVLAIGPGVGTAAESVEAVRRIVAETSLPTVIDADGLNAFAGEISRLGAPQAPRVLTPHPGEMARLVGSETSDVQVDRAAHARSLAEKTGSTVVLKGHRTLIVDPDGRLVINPTGNPGMASGGSGDVLTGLIGAFLGQSLGPGDAAQLGAFVHGRAGDLAADEVGEISLIAGDIVEALPDAFLSLEVDDEPSG